MTNFYQKFDIKNTTSSKRATLILLKKINNLPPNQALPKAFFVALNIFLEPTIKKYYDIYLFNGRLNQKSTALLKATIEELESTPSNDLPRNYLFHDSYFLRKSWYWLLLRALAIDFFFHHFIIENHRGETKNLINYISFRLAFFKVFLIYALPMILVMYDNRLVAIPIFIFVFRLIYHYNNEKIEFCQENMKKG